jgi:hypothetical protein
MKPITVHAYDLSTGKHLSRLPYTSASWSESINEAGTLNVETEMNNVATRANLRSLVRPWKTILAAQRGNTVIHAGPVTTAKWDASTRKISWACGGGWTLLTKRLVLNHNLDETWKDGDVLIDEEHPAGAWALSLSGSYRDIAAGLISETLKWGRLPITIPPREGGDFTRTYNGWDMATISDRITDLGKLENGPEIRFTPLLDANWNLSYTLEAEQEIIDHHLRLNSILPQVRVILTGVNEDGAPLTTQSYAIGGKNEDKTLMARASSQLEEMTLLQSADTQHTTISELPTLQQVAHQSIIYGARNQETYSFSIGEEYDPHVGDWADIRIEDDYLGEQVLTMKITDVSGSSSSEYLTIQARPRIES